jgi:hypothetical protein
MANPENSTISFFLKKNGEVVVRRKLYIHGKNAKILRENILGRQFVAYFNNKFNANFSREWTERDAPHDFTFNDQNDRELLVEIISISNQSSIGPVTETGFMNTSNRQYLEQAINQKFGSKAGLMLFFSPWISRSDLQNFVNGLGDKTIPYIDISKTRDSNELIDANKRVLKDGQPQIYRMKDNQSGTNLFNMHSDEATIGQYIKSVLSAIHSKEGKDYACITDMVLLIDDKTTHYTQEEITKAISENIYPKAIASPFRAIYMIDSLSSNLQGNGGDFGVYPIKPLIKL